ncbi:hypothetical protein GGS23DRAFT_86257 [Durotheca rogersii]|uniref:uncharacterized protein n=1 Tax=Durotheca rogersii TaxID=419775 RepID=UPI00221FB83F|nr:uncharacterized protein GGS23DRAFT_86257 [Durotheca rogersii]KAI5862664.1 hypothetical protein GGS23DRAFT_86257 [Durotheca rogersii]
MATAETVELGEPHAPREESIKVFNEIEADLKKTLLHMKHTYLKHEPEYFAAVQSLPDAALTGFGAVDLEQVRVGASAYGVHLFGKVRIPAAGDPPAYLHFRAFVGGDGHDRPGVATLHAIHTEERLVPADGDGDAPADRRYRAVFTRDDPLEWFDT